MRNEIREKIDEIDLVVNALDELSQMMQKNNMETPGGTCMALLARKIESELNALWLILKRVDSSMAAE